MMGPCIGRMVDTAIGSGMPSSAPSVISSNKLRSGVNNEPNGPPPDVITMTNVTISINVVVVVDLQQHQ